MAYLHAHPFWYIDGKNSIIHRVKKRVGLNDTGATYKEAFTHESEKQTAGENIWTKAKKFFGAGKKRKVTQKKVAGE